MAEPAVEEIRQFDNEIIEKKNESKKTARMHIIQMDALVERLTNKIRILEDRLEIAENNYAKFMKVLNSAALKIKKFKERMDDTSMLDLTKSYGFSGDTMYYIGVATGTIYSKPINSEIVSLISSLKPEDEDTRRVINRYFMDIKN